MTLDYRIGDVFDRLAEIPDGSIDLIVTSPPFLALRSYLPADHPDKSLEIGSEPTPAAFIDTLLALSAEWGRVLAPHGSLCVELGDTFAGSGGAGGDYNPGGLRDGQDKFDGSGRRIRTDTKFDKRDDGRPGGGITNLNGKKQPGGQGWPLAKSLTGIPTLYTWSLAYGRNLLTGEPSQAGPWRIRNVIVWARPNPPVGALGDKFRPATSYITVACKSARRYFDLDAVRTPSDYDRPNLKGQGSGPKDKANRGPGHNHSDHTTNAAGAPPLDWHADDHPEDGDWLWKLSTQPYKGSHYATFPLTLPKRLIEAMCPLRVCTECGAPSTRITRLDGYTDHADKPGSRTTTTTTVGWSDCGHDAWRPGVVLDPFAGSGTTLDAAQAVGRHAIGIDLDARNADLAIDRVGMFLTIDHAEGAA